MVRAGATMRAPVIIGGGPAGATAALALRQADQPVVLLERQAEPSDKLCGDFLGLAAIQMAGSFGVSLAELGASPVTHLRVIRRGHSVDSPLPFPAMAIRRSRFDAALLRAAEAAGAQVVMGQAVPPHKEEQGDFIIESQALGTLTTGTLFLATGRPRTAAPGSSRRGPTAYKMYFRPKRSAVSDLFGRVELEILQGGQSAIQMVDRETLMFCLLSRRHDSEQPWEDVLAHTLACSPTLARRLGRATPLLAEPLVAHDLPLGFTHRSRGADHEGLYRIGDQAALLSSLLADGVSVGMRGATRAVRTLLSGAGAGAYHRRLRAMLWPRSRLQADYVPAGLAGPAAGSRAASIDVTWRVAVGD